MVVKSDGVTQGRKAGSRTSATSAPVILVTLPVHIPSPLPGLQVPASLHCHGSEQGSSSVNNSHGKAIQKPETQNCTNLGKDGPAVLPHCHVEIGGDIGMRNLTSEWLSSGLPKNQILQSHCFYRNINDIKLVISKLYLALVMLFLNKVKKKC